MPVGEKTKKLWLDPAYRERMRLSHLGKKQSKEHIEKRIKKYSGENHWTTRKSFTDETKLKMREAKLKNPSMYWLGKTFVTSDVTKEKQRYASLRNGNKPPHFKGDKSPKWKGGIPNCKKCDKKLTYYNKTRECLDCKKKEIRNEKICLCGTSFIEIKSRPQAFCSKKCFAYKKNLSQSKIENPNHIFSNTKIEQKISKLLDMLGVDYMQNYGLEKIANVDFFIPNKMLVIQCDGCYWHGCPEHFPKEIKRKEKDGEQDIKLKSLGYKVIRLWEHEINKLETLNI